MLSFVSRFREYFFPSALAADFWKNRTVVADVAISPYIRTCGEILARHNLKTTVHAFGTNVEGNLTNVKEAVADCIETLHKQNIPHVSAIIKLSSDTKKENTLDSRMKSVA